MRTYDVYHHIPTQRYVFYEHAYEAMASLHDANKSLTREFETGLSQAEMLKTLVLPKGLKAVGGFNSCPKLTGLVLPEGLEVLVERQDAGDIHKNPDAE